MLSTGHTHTHTHTHTYIYNWRREKDSHISRLLLATPTYLLKCFPHHFKQLIKDCSSRICLHTMDSSSFIFFDGSIIFRAQGQYTSQEYKLYNHNALVQILYLPFKNCLSLGKLLVYLPQDKY